MIGSVCKILNAKTIIYLHHKEGKKDNLISQFRLMLCDVMVNNSMIKDFLFLIKSVIRYQSNMFWKK